MWVLHHLLGTRLEVLTKLVPLYGLTAVLAVAVLVPALPGALLHRVADRRRGATASPVDWRTVRHQTATGLLALACGAAVGLTAAWIASDVVDVVGVRFTPVIRAWFALAFGGVALAIARLWRASPRRRLLAAALIPASLLAGAFGINVDVAAFPTLNALLHRDTLRPLALRPLPAHLPALSDWHAPGGLHRHGALGTVRIPATLSGFHARPAVVYLPPAALTRDPPRLPVLLSLSGQPGWPTDVFVNGGLEQILDRYAAHHRGVAPVVIAADQLGLPGNNPMCLDSRLGDVATYLTRDVPAWAEAHLPVVAKGWGVEGFSEGGTCAVQLLPSDRRLFSAALAIAPEAVEEDRGTANTVHEAFDGDAARYRASTPVELLRSGAPFRHDVAVIGWGSDDSDFATDSMLLARAAGRAGMTVRTIEAPDSAHDWHTVHFVLARGLPVVIHHLLALDCGSARVPDDPRSRR